MRFFIVYFFISIFAGGIMSYTQEKSHNNERIIILMGPPGSGKGTQAVRLIKEFSIPHISTGDLFRENISKETPLSRQAKEYMNAGKLVPDEIVLNMLSERISRPDSKHGYLLDGFPRTIPQAEALDQLLKNHSKPVVISLEVSDDLLIKRLEGRLTCKNCGHLCNRYFSAPKKEGTCDKCQGELIQRPDDKLEIVEERLRVYHNQTKPLIEFYAKKGLLHKINGEQEPDKTFRDIMNVLK
jgi:adenylate kinase